MPGVALERRERRPARSPRAAPPTQLGDRRLLDAALAEGRQHLRDVVQERGVRARRPARRSGAAARDRCRAGRRRGAARPRSCRCPVRPGCTARCRGRRAPDRPGRAGWSRRCRASARRAAVRSPRAAGRRPARAPRRGRGARPRRSDSRRRGSRTGGAAARPCGRRAWPGRRPGDRRPPVDDDRVAAVVADVPAADVEDLAGRCVGVAVAVGAAEERRRVRVGGQRARAARRASGRGRGWPARRRRSRRCDRRDACIASRQRRARSRWCSFAGRVRHQSPRLIDATRRGATEFRPIRVASCSGGTRPHAAEPRGRHRRTPRARPAGRVARLDQPVAAVGSVPVRDGSGAPCARTTPPTATPGPTCRSSTPTRRAYRWGEDGLGGICDRYGFLNFSVALWNGRDPIAQGAAVRPDQRRGQPRRGRQGVLVGRSTARPPTRGCSGCYRYPQAEFPYAQLRGENAARGRDQREYELADTGVLADDRFFDVTVSYAKAAPDDVAIVVEATNHGPDPAPLHLLPQVWFRNTWAWGRDDRTPALRRVDPPERARRRRARGRVRSRLPRPVHRSPPTARRTCSSATTRRTPSRCSASTRNPTPYTKDGIDSRVVHGDESAVNPDGTGTKAAFWYRVRRGRAGRDGARCGCGWSHGDPDEHTFGPASTRCCADRAAEADDFYARGAARTARPTRTRRSRGVRSPGCCGASSSTATRSPTGSTAIRPQPAPPPQRARAGCAQRVVAAPLARRRDLHAGRLGVPVVRRVGSRVPLRRARARRPGLRQGAVAAACAASGRCTRTGNCPPTNGRSATSTRRCTRGRRGRCTSSTRRSDDATPTSSIRVFTKLLLNFGWWVNRKDADGSNLFEGGFLGMDNIGLFDRSAPLPRRQRGSRSRTRRAGSRVYCLNMLHDRGRARAHRPGLGRGRRRSSSSTSWRSRRRCAGSARSDVALWDDDGRLLLRRARASGRHARSSCGCARWSGCCRCSRSRTRGSGAGRAARLHRPAAVAAAAPARAAGRPAARTAGAATSRPITCSPCSIRTGCGRVLPRMFDEEEFLSPYGIRSLSAAYRTPFTTDVDGQQLSIDYEPGESRTGLFGGNSNWRGPVWFPVNVLLADALRTYHGVPRRRLHGRGADRVGCSD